MKVFVNGWSLLLVFVISTYVYELFAFLLSSCKISPLKKCPSQAFHDLDAKAY